MEESPEVASYILEEIGDALSRHGKTRDILASNAPGVPYGVKSIRQAFSEAQPLKVEIAHFLVQRAHEEGILSRATSQEMHAMIRLCDVRECAVEVGIHGELIPMRGSHCPNAQRIAEETKRRSPRLTRAALDAVAAAAEWVEHRGRRCTHVISETRAYLRARAILAEIGALRSHALSEDEI